MSVATTSSSGEKSSNTTSGSGSNAAPLKQGGSSAALYGWILVLLGVAVAAVVLGWHAGTGPVDPSVPGTRMGPTAAMLNSAVLVFREGLECILVLAAITASFRSKKQPYRRPVALGGVIGIGASAATWFIAAWLIGTFGGNGLTVQAATGIPAIIVLLLVMNWFLHKVYWNGWISHHNKRRRGVVSSAGSVSARNTLIGLAMLGFTSVYREGFEIVIFLQGLRERFGSSVVAEGLVLGLLFTAAVGVLTFAVHARLPYKKMLVITGGLLVVVLWVMVGEEINEMQLAGWIGTTAIPGLHVPPWAGTWFSVFPNVETLIAQSLALVLVVGSYGGAKLLQAQRMRRPARRRVPDARPEEPALAK